MNFHLTALKLITAQRKATLQGRPLAARPTLRRIIDEAGAEQVATLSSPPFSANARTQDDPLFQDSWTLLGAYLAALDEAQDGNEAAEREADFLKSLLRRQLAGDPTTLSTETIHRCWLGWTPAQTRKHTVKAVGDGPQAGKTLYGQKAQRALGYIKSAHHERSERAAKAHEIVRKVFNQEDLDESHIKQFVDHADAMTVDQLRQARAVMAARFGGAKKHEHMVEALRDHVRNVMGTWKEREDAANEELPARESRPPANLFQKKEEGPTNLFNKESDGEGNVRGVFTLPNGEKFRGKWRTDTGYSDEALKDKATKEYFAHLVMNEAKASSHDEAVSIGSETERKKSEFLDHVTGGKSSEVVADYESQSGNRRQYRVIPKYDNVSGIYFQGVYDIPESNIHDIEVGPKHSSYEDAASDIGNHLESLGNRVEDLQIRHPATKKNFEEIRSLKSAKAQAEREAEAKAQAERHAKEISNQESKQKIADLSDKLKGRKGVINIGGVDVPATYIGEIAIHKTNDRENPYTLSHAGTGLKATDARSMGEAKQIATILGMTGNLNFTDVKKADKNVLQSMSRVVRAFKNGDYDDVLSQLQPKDSAKVTSDDSAKVTSDDSAKISQNISTFKNTRLIPRVVKKLATGGDISKAMFTPGDDEDINAFLELNGVDNILSIPMERRREMAVEAVKNGRIPEANPSVPETGVSGAATNAHYMTYTGRLSDKLAEIVRKNHPGEPIPEGVLNSSRIQTRFNLGIRPEDAAEEIYNDLVKPRIGQKPTQSISEHLRKAMDANKLAMERTSSESGVASQSPSVESAKSENWRDELKGKPRWQAVDVLRNRPIYELTADEYHNLKTFDHEDGETDPTFDPSNIRMGNIRDQIKKQYEQHVRSQWEDARDAAYIAGKSVSKVPDWATTQADFIRDSGNDMEDHRNIVSAAISAGKPVPPEVLADYPDLAAQHGNAKTTPADASASPAIGIPSQGEPGISPITHGAKLEDIPYQTAYDAHRNTSFSPEIRAKQRQQDYVSQMQSDWDHLAKFAQTPEDLQKLKEEFDRYKNGYRDRYLAKLHAASRTASSMITGPANFPTESNLKRLETEHRRLNELVDFRKRAMAAIQKKLSPNDFAIKSNDPEAVARLTEKLHEAESRQKKMKAINEAHKRFLKDPASLDSNMTLTDGEKSAIRNYRPAYSWEPHPHAPYELTNNSANIRRIQQRIDDLSKMKSSGPKEEEYTGGIKVVHDPDAARIRIHFPEKPSKDAIEKLKSGGFRWSPSEGAWQRHLNNGGIYATTSLLKNLGHEPIAVEEKPTESEPAIPDLMPSTMEIIGKDEDHSASIPTGNTEKVPLDAAMEHTERLYNERTPPNPVTPETQPNVQTKEETSIPSPSPTQATGTTNGPAGLPGPVDGGTHSGSDVGGIGGAGNRPAQSEPERPRVITSREHLTPKADTSIIPENLRPHLNEVQQQGVALAIKSMEKNGGHLNADGTGTGKSRQQLAVAQHFLTQGKKVIIITPKMVIRPDFKKGTITGSFADGANAMGIPLNLTKGDTPLSTDSVNFSTYENLSKLKGQIDNNTVVLFDESHALKNADTARAKHGKEISDNAASVMYSTATPGDMPLHIAHLSRAGVFGNIGKSATLSKLGMELVPHPKRELAAQGAKIWRAPKGKAREMLRRINGLFDQMTREGLMVKRELSMHGVEFNTNHIQLQPHERAEIDRVFNEKMKETDGNKAMALMAARNAQEQFKVPQTASLIKQELAAGRQPVIFLGRVNDIANDDAEDDDDDSVSHGTAKLLKQALIDAGVPEADIAELHGAATKTEAQKTKATNDFQSGKKKVMIATVASGGTGINLDDTKGDSPRTVIMMTPPLTANDMAQAVGRVHRLNTKSNSKVVGILSDTPIDEWNAKLLAKKFKTMGAVVGGEMVRGQEAIRPADAPDEIEDDNLAPFEWGESLHHIPKHYSNTPFHHNDLIKQFGGKRVMRNNDWTTEFPSKEHFDRYRAHVAEAEKPKQSATPATPKPAPSPKPSSGGGYAMHKGRKYRVLYRGKTKFGQKAKLGFMDGTGEFWVDEHVPTYLSGRPDLVATLGAGTIWDVLSDPSIDRFAFR